MATHVEGRLLSRSIPYVEKWISDLTPATATSTTAPAKEGGKGKEKNNNNNNNKNNNNKEDEGTPMSRCCFAVGKVVEVSRHPESDKLYIEKIDMGAELNTLLSGDAATPRVILSGLQEFVKEEEFLNRLVLVIANLEPRKIAGIPSNGMVLCASTTAGEGEGRKVVLLDIPAGTAVGERITFEGHEQPYLPVLKKKLSKNFEEVIVEVKTNEKGEVCWKDLPFRTSAGVITASLSNATIS